MNSTGWGTLGRVAVVGDLARPTFADSHITVLAVDQELGDARFVAYALIAGGFPATAEHALSVGATKQIELNVGTLRRFSVSAPDPAEQRTIADFLDAETARIDVAISRAASLLTLIDERTASFRERLLPAQTVAMLVPLRRVATVQTGLTLNAAKSSDSREERPYLRVANVQPGALDLDSVKRVRVGDEQIRRHSLKYGDVLMTEGGDRDKLGRGVVWRDEVPGALHQNHVFAVRPEVSRLLPEYLEMVLASSRARRYFESTANQTTNLASTNTAIVGALDLPKPPVRDQRQIVEEFGAVERRHQALKTAVTCQITLLRERRRTLITAAVSGRVDVGG